MSSMSVLIANLLVTAINLGILMASIKIYTEQLKDKKFDSRAQQRGHDGGLPTK